MTTNQLVYIKCPRSHTVAHVSHSPKPIHRDLSATFIFRIACPQCGEPTEISTGFDSIIEFDVDTEPEGEPT